MNINERIKEIRKHFCNNSNVKFAKKLSKGVNTTSNYTRNGYSVGGSVANDIIRAFPELNIEWLLTGEGEMLKPAKNPFGQMTEKEIGESVAEVLMDMYKSGEIYPAGVHEKIIAEKVAEIARRDQRIEELQREIWELQRQLVER